MSVAGEHILARFAHRDDGDGINIGDLRFVVKEIDREINAVHREIEQARLEYNRVRAVVTIPNEK